MKLNWIIIHYYNFTVNKASAYFVSFNKLSEQLEISSTSSKSTGMTKSSLFLNISQLPAFAVGTYSNQWLTVEIKF